MPSLTPKLPILCLAGATGAGKTALALELASLLNAEIINADSRQVYADFPIITAQPTAQERQGCPHHLYGYLATQEQIDTTRWMEKAVACIQDVLGRGKVPILVGGTGFYFQTLLRGIAQIPAIDPDLHQALIARMEEQGSVAMHALLQQLDPTAASHIHCNDRQRILRALEVAQGTGKPISWWHQHAEGLAPCTGLLLVVQTNLADLEPRLARRIDVMLAEGALEEGRLALGKCNDILAPGWSGIGCREVCAYITEQIDFETMKSFWFKNTRAYAKRQITWFKGRKETIWIDPSNRAAMRSLLRDFGYSC